MRSVGGVTGVYLGGLTGWAWHGIENECHHKICLVFGTKIDVLFLILESFSGQKVELRWNYIMFLTEMSELADHHT